MEWNNKRSGHGKHDQLNHQQTPAIYAISMAIHTIQCIYSFYTDYNDFGLTSLTDLLLFLCTSLIADHNACSLWLAVKLLKYANLPNHFQAPFSRLLRNCHKEAHGPILRAIDAEADPEQKVWCFVHCVTHSVTAVLL